MRITTAIVLLAVAAAGCSAGASPQPRPHRPVPAAAATPPPLLVGVYEADDPGSYGQVASFAAATGVQPRLVVYYSNWGMPFASAFASQVRGHGARPLVQIEPRGVSIAGVAAGTQDGYLRTLARRVRAYGHPVVISFGQEMNGSWYPWGAGHVPPQVFIAAWRHIVDVFRAQGARNVTWLWNINCGTPAGQPASDWWPGASYVGWVGIDCYYFYRSSTFAGLFASTITAVRQMTTEPILIAETAVGQVAGAAEIPGLFAGARKDHLLGVVWFDKAQQGGIHHQDWRLEDDPAALAAFRAAARSSR
jgi:hypothetical protein